MQRRGTDLPTALSPLRTTEYTTDCPGSGVKGTILAAGQGAGLVALRPVTAAAAAAPGGAHACISLANAVSTFCADRESARADMSAWRAAGLTYLQYLNITSTLLRSVAKEPVRSNILKRDLIGFKVQNFASATSKAPSKGAWSRDVLACAAVAVCCPRLRARRSEQRAGDEGDAHARPARARSGHRSVLSPDGRGQGQGIIDCPHRLKDCLLSAGPALCSFRLWQRRAGLQRSGGLHGGLFALASTRDEVGQS